MDELKQLNPNANVVINMKGLGLAHHNENAGRWEFLFIRKIEYHDLKIIVREYRKSSINPVEYPYQIPINNKPIEITTTDAVSPSSSHHKPNPSRPFMSRKGIDDELDAQWMIDLSAYDFHGKPVKLAKKKYRDGTSVGTPVVLTLLTVSDSIFYTASGSKRPYTIKFNGNPCFPRFVGEWMGFDIEWQTDTSHTDIKFSSDVLTDRPLIHDSDIIKYEIEINNDCCEGQVGRPSDFHYYYDLLVNMPEEVFDEDVSLPISRSNLFTKLSSNEFADSKIFDRKSMPRLELYSAALFEFLFGGKEDDCHLVQCSDLDGFASLEDFYKNG
jgi:hypothetical protein